MIFSWDLLKNGQTQDITGLTCWGQTPNVYYVSGFCLHERSIINTFFLKRISFHFALPPVGLRAEVARRWWLSLWWRDPPWAWFSVITSHTHINTLREHCYPEVFLSPCFYLWELLSLTHCCAERGFNDLTWLGFLMTCYNLFFAGPYR